MEKMVSIDTIKEAINILLTSELPLDRISEATLTPKNELKMLKDGTLKIENTRFDVIDGLYKYCMEIKGESDESLEACIQDMLLTENINEVLSQDSKKYVYKGFNCEIETLQRIKAITKDKPRGTETKLINLMLKIALDRIENDGEL